MICVPRGRTYYESSSALFVMTPKWPFLHIQCPVNQSLNSDLLLTLPLIREPRNLVRTPLPRLRVAVRQALNSTQEQKLIGRSWRSPAPLVITEGISCHGREPLASTRFEEETSPSFCSHRSKTEPNKTEHFLFDKPQNYFKGGYTKL